MFLAIDKPVTSRAVINVFPQWRRGAEENMIWSAAASGIPRDAAF
jgi:hypothetical protein